ncbi:MAG: single-stranded-DNA-specific exonuclease RecJ [Deltaproteobacteria bacterium]|nr:single-stranded-DNA-specific exonuclease RecJ [Deltaproteobacteria bacterium]
MAGKKTGLTEIPEDPQGLSQKTGLSRTVCQLLFNRGFRTAEEISRYLYGSLRNLPPPSSLPDMEKGVARIRQALSHREKIFLFGDYDVDGVTGTAILQLFLQSQGGDVSPLLPNRFTDGYGLSHPVIHKVSDGGGRLLITIDNGTKAEGPIRFAKEKGIDVIILDHHETPETDPGAIALINPKKERDEARQLPLCSAGLAFYLVAALRASLRQPGSPPLESPLIPYLDLVALGTVADIVPLIGVNRLLVREGLKVLSNSSRIGLQRLKEEASLKEASLSTGHIGFRLAPRLNASGRLEDASLSLELLTTNDLLRAGALARQLESINRRRQEIEEGILQEAEELLEARPPSDGAGIALAREGWHEGVLGIVAARLTERYARPALVLTIRENDVKGSGRSIRGFDLHDCLLDCSSFLDKWGGHKAAVGLTLKKQNLQPFLDQFSQVSIEKLKKLDGKSGHRVDLSLPFSDLTPQLIEELAAMEPFGYGNPEPVFRTSSVTIRSAKIVGKNHLKMILCQDNITLDSIHFNYRGEIPTQPLCHVTYTPEWNEWNGNRVIQLRIKEIN